MAVLLVCNVLCMFKLLYGNFIYISLYLSSFCRAFNFQCEKWTSGVKAVYNEEQSTTCTAVFDWFGNVGCPVCQPADYDTMVRARLVKIVLSYFDHLFIGLFFYSWASARME